MTVAPKKTPRRSWCRFSKQREALQSLGITAGQLKSWLRCEYLRARGLRGGALMLTGAELALIQEHSPIGGKELAKRIALSSGDVRLAQLGLALDGGDTEAKP